MGNKANKSNDEFISTAAPSKQLIQLQHDLATYGTSSVLEYLGILTATKNSLYILLLIIV